MGIRKTNMRNKVTWVVVLCLQVLCLQAQVKCSLGGRLFVDGGAFFAAPDTLNSGVGIPEARLTGKVYLDNDWYVKLDVGVASNKVSLKDAFLQKTHHVHTLRLGYMIGMFSLDQSSSTNDYLFMTGSNVAETFYPGRRIGVSYTYSDKKFYFSGGAFCGDGLNYRKEVKQGVNATVRAVFRPLNTETSLLHIGAGGLFKRPDKDVATGTRSLALCNTGNTYLSVPYVCDAGMTDVKAQFQWNVEALLHYRKFFMQGELMEMRVNRYGRLGYRACGGYCEGGYFVWGDKMGYDMRDALPVCTDTPKALAVFARINYTDLNDSELKCGSVFDVSLGLNYYLNKNLIFRLNYSNVNTDEFAAIPDVRYHLVQSRVQVKF